MNGRSLLAARALQSLRQAYPGGTGGRVAARGDVLGGMFEGTRAGSPSAGERADAPAATREAETSAFELTHPPGDPVMLGIYGPEVMDSEHVHHLITAELGEREPVRAVVTAGDAAAGVCRIARDVAQWRPVPLVLIHPNPRLRRGAAPKQRRDIAAWSDRMLLFTSGLDPAAEAMLQEAIQRGIPYRLHRIAEGRGEVLDEDWGGILG